MAPLEVRPKITFSLTAAFKSRINSARASSRGSVITSSAGVWCSTRMSSSAKGVETCPLMNSVENTKRGGRRNSKPHPVSPSVATPMGKLGNQTHERKKWRRECMALMCPR